MIFINRVGTTASVESQKQLSEFPTIKDASINNNMATTFLVGYILK